jgi:hypothetical protein
MERTLMVTQRSSLVPGHIAVESKRSGFVARALIAAGFAAAIALSPVSSAHAGDHKAGISAADKKAEAKAAREKKKAERAAAKAEKAKSKKSDGDKVAKVDNKRDNDDMGGSDDPLEGL